MLVVGTALFESQSAVESLPRRRLWLGGLAGLGTGVVALNCYVALSAAPV